MNVIYDVALVIHECYLCCSREDQIEKISIKECIVNRKDGSRERNYINRVSC